MLHDLPAPIHKLIIERMREEPLSQRRFTVNVLISGNSGSGKTTLANLLANHVREQRRVAFIHDPGDRPSLNPTNMPVLREVRKSKGPQRLDFTRDMMKMRVDWIVQDELRDAATSMQIHAGLSGYNTLSTIHAPNPLGALERLTNLAMLDVNDHPLITKRVKMSDYLIIQVHRGRQGYQIVEVAETLKNAPAAANDLTLVSGGNVKDPNLVYHLNTLYQR